MAEDYSTKLAEGFSSKVMRVLYDRNILDSIVNRDYEGEINAVGSILNILDFEKLSEKTYANVPLTVDELEENNGQLIYCFGTILQRGSSTISKSSR